VINALTNLFSLPESKTQFIEKAFEETKDDLFSFLFDQFPRYLSASALKLMSDPLSKLYSALSTQSSYKLLEPLIEKGLLDQVFHLLHSCPLQRDSVMTNLTTLLKLFVKSTTEEELAYVMDDLMSDRIKSFPRYGTISFFEDINEDKPKMPTGYEVLEAIESQYANDSGIGGVIKEIFDVIHG
jgi:hypothetical protein